MRKMKDSGIEWIGKIPENWDAHPLYVYFSERKNRNRLGKEINLLSLSYGKIIRKDINNLEGLLPESFNTYNIVESGDIIIRPTDLQNDKRSLRTGLVDEKGIITAAYIDLKPIVKLSSRYFHYLLHAYDTEKVFYNMGNGVRQGLNFSEISRLMVFYPPFSEQKAIAEYLDKRCGEIDSAIGAAKELIEEYKEYKRSLITEAVTKGLDPKVKTKDSGIEWIGKIPENWVVKKIKYVTDVNPRITVSFDKNKPVSYTPMTIIKNGYMSPLSAIVDTLPTGLVEYQEGDIVMAKVTPCFENGNIAIAKNLKQRIAFGSSELFSFRTKSLFRKFLFYYLQSSGFKNACILTMHGVAGLQRIAGSFVNNAAITNPPLSEQKAIAKYLDEKCSLIDSLISEKESLVSELEEYKKSLIFECVTGKEEVA